MDQETVLPPSSNTTLLSLLQRKANTRTPKNDCICFDHFDDEPLIDFLILIENNCLEEIKSLMEMNVPREDIVYLWFLSVFFSFDDVTIEMVKCGFDMNESWYIGQNSYECFTVLGHLARKEVEDSTRGSCIEFILGLGVDVNSKVDDLGRTALMIATEHNCLSTIQLLLENGADLTIKDYDGKNVLMWACDAQKEEAAAFWIAKNVGVNDVDNDGNTALMVVLSTAQYEDMEVVRTMILLLFEHGACVNIANKEGKTALMMMLGFTEILELLLELGANIDAQDNNGTTALLRRAGVSSYECVESVQVLLKYHANTDIQDKEGWTALMRASNCNHKNLVALLLYHGADKELTNKNDQTAFDLARLKEIKKMIKNHVDTTYVLK